MHENELALNESISFNDVLFSEFRVDEESRGRRPGVLSTVEGPFMEIEAVNRNERKYSLSLVMNRILNAPYTIEMLKNKMLLGEGRHPKDRFEIWTTDASHNITDLWVSEDNRFLMGRADILDTPTGRIIQTLIDYGSKLGVSARAQGKVVRTNGGFYVDEGTYKFKTFDFVTNPGFESSRVEGVSESVEEGNYLDGIYNPVRSLVESGDTDPQTLRAVKAVLESVDNSKMKELIPLIEERLEGDSTEVAEQIARLEGEATVLKEQMGDMQVEIDCLSGEVNDGLLREETLRKENEFLRETLQQYADGDGDPVESEDPAEEITKLKRWLGVKSGVIKALKTSNDDLSLENESLRDMVSQLLGIVDALSEESETLRESATDSKAKVSQLLEEAQVLRARIAKPVAPTPVRRPKKEVPLLESIVEGGPVKSAGVQRPSKLTDIRLVNICKRVGNK